MRELQINELDMVAGGFSLPSLTSATTINAVLSAGSYVSYSYLSGNRPTLSGAVATALVGGIAKVGGNPVTVKGAANVIGIASSTGAIEGVLNGEGPLYKQISGISRTETAMLESGGWDVV